MDSRTIGLLIALVVLVILSGLFSATETAYTSFSAVRMRRFAKRKRTARMALRLSADYNRILTTLLVADNIVNIASATIGTLIFTSLLGEDVGSVVSTVTVTIVLLIFGEITPKLLAKRLPEAFACAAAYPLFVCICLFLPIVFLFDVWKKAVFYVCGLGKKEPRLNEEEFKMLVTDVKEEGVLNDTEQDLIHKTLRYDELTVADCMVPLERVVAVDIRENDRIVFRVFRETNFSRLPVYKGTKGNIEGVLYRADFYENMLAGRRDFDNIVRPISAVSPDEKVSELMERLRTMREHMLIVGSEDDALGIITREDMIEELLGDVDDKYDLTPVTSLPTPEPVSDEEDAEKEEEQEEGDAKKEKKDKEARK